MKKLRVVTFIIIVIVIIFINVIMSSVLADPINIKYQTDESYPPYAYKQGDDLLGFDFELVRLIFSQSPYEVEYSADVFALVYDRLVKGEIDSAGIIAVKEERKKEILYSDTVLQSFIGVYTRSDRPNLKINELKHYKIGVRRGFYTEQVLKEKAGLSYYYTYDNVEDALIDLDKGNIDAVFGNQETINFLISKKEFKNTIVPNIPNLYPFDLAIGIKKTNPQLVNFINSQLKSLKRSGAFELLYQKYFFSHSPEYYNKRNNNFILIIVGIIVFFSIIVIFLRFYIKNLEARIIKSNRETMLQKAYFKQLFESSPQATVMIDLDDNVLDVNGGFENLYGYNAEEIKGQKLSNFIMPLGNENEGIEINNLILKGRFYQEEAKRRKKDNCLVDVSILGYPIILEGQKIGVYGIYTDISERIKQEEIVKYQAYYDQLTNLPNRRIFMERLEVAIGIAKEQNKMIAVLFIDLDKFKNINDSFGHNIGDKLLIAVGCRLTNSVKSGDLVARMGGDEFIIMLENIESKDIAFNIIRRIHESFGSPFIIDGNEINISASIGTSFYPCDGEDGEALLIKSDNRMYLEKSKVEKFQHN